jgi:uncharacterized membrane-anchored protein YitT (DUF2179 family)
LAGISLNSGANLINYNKSILHFGRSFLKRNAPLFALAFFKQKRTQTIAPIGNAESVQFFVNLLYERN